MKSSRKFLSAGHMRYATGNQMQSRHHTFQMEENAKDHPLYQESYGNWLNWTVPGTDCNLPIFASGWGDGYYPVYFGYSANNETRAIYVHFIDIKASYNEKE